MKILVTGFEPFGGESINPSYEAVKLLPDRISGAEIVKALLPVAFVAAGKELIATMDRENLIAVIAVGQAGGRAGISIERVAVNLRDARIKDNLGAQPRDEPIFPCAPAAYFATLPTRKIADALAEKGIAASLSYTAGTYVCNEVMYTLLHHIEKKRLPTLGGFIHVPYSTGQAAKKASPQPGMDIAEMAEALKLTIEKTIEEIR